MPAAVLAEGLFSGHVGRDSHVRRMLDLVRIVDVNELVGLAAGELRRQATFGGARPQPSGVDAIVAAAADGVGAEALVVTSDAGDIGALLVHADSAAQVKILAV